MLDSPWSLEAEVGQAFLVLQPSVLQGDEERGTPLVVQALEGEEADRGPPGSSFPREENEQAAHRRTSRSGCSHGRRVPGTTEHYCGTRLPSAGKERTGVNQAPSFAGVVVVRETCHRSTSARPWNGPLSPERR